MSRWIQESRADRQEIARLQTEKLKAMTAEICKTNSFYRRKFKQAGFERGSFSLEELQRLPFTTKDELSADQAQNPPYGSNLTYPLDRYVRMHQSSGTKGGTPLRWLDTPVSWNWLMGLWEVIYDLAGIRSDDRFFFPFSFGPFLGFWTGFEAAVRQGHLTLAGGGMTTPARIKIILDHEITIIGCTPTYALHMAEVAKENKIDLTQSKVRALIVAGEPGGNIRETKQRIEEAWDARCFDHSGMTEIGSLGMECAENPGGIHLIESECIAEILDLKTGQSCAPGEKGELILSNLGRWGSPLIRYRTGDIVCAEPEPCPCGRSLIRLKGGILGRADDMVLIRGNNVYPAALEAIVRRFPEVAEYRAEVSMREGLAVLSLTIESDQGIGSNGPSLSERIASAVKDSLNFRPEVNAVRAGTLPRFEMKATRFVIHPSYRKEQS